MITASRYLWTTISSESVNNILMADIYMPFKIIIVNCLWVNLSERPIGHTSFTESIFTHVCEDVVIFHPGWRAHSIQRWIRSNKSRSDKSFPTVACFFLKPLRNNTNPLLPHGVGLVDRLLHYHRRHQHLDTTSWKLDESFPPLLFAFPWMHPYPQIRLPRANQYLPG